MARIRLRHCTLRFIDGFSATAVVAAGATPADTDLPLEIDSFTAVNPLTATTIPALTRFIVEDTNEIYHISAVGLGPASGAVDDTPIDGDLTLTVDTITGRVPVGTTFTIVGDSVTHTVVSTVETGGNTTEITFTPKIDTATGVPLDDAVITFAQRPNLLTFTPALATAATVPVAGKIITVYGRCVEIKVGDGNVTWDTSRNLEYEMDKGEIDAVVEGDDIPVDVSIDLVYEYLTAVTGSGIPTAEDVLKQRGEASTWITSGEDSCEVYAIDIEIDYEPPCAAQHEITTFPEFRWESVSHDVSQASLAVRGKCKDTDVTIVRRAY
jgi:hypothetical protein